MMRGYKKILKKEWIQWIITICLATFFMSYIIFKGISCPSFIETYYKNNVARIDIGVNKGKDIKLLTNIKDNINWPEWQKNEHGQGFVANFNISKSWKNFKIDLIPSSDGGIQLRLLGPDKRLNNKRFPVKISYRNLKINEQSIELKNNLFWHDSSFFYNIDVKKDIPVRISVDIKIPSLTLKEIYTLNKINLYILFSLFIIFLLIFRKIIHYLSKFYYNKETRIDIVLLIVFFGLLWLPMSNISKEEKSEQENRMLAPKPQFTITGKNINNFGKQFDAWFNDRFLGRENVIKIYNKLKYKFISNYYITSKGCGNKKTKWLGSCRGKRSLFSNEQLEKTSRSISKLLDFAKRNNIKVYFLIAPSQGSVYGKNILPWYNNDNEHEQIYQIADYLKKKNSIEVIYPYREILEASKNEFMFFKTDTHWTDSAAFIAYNAVMKKIKNDFNDIKVMKIETLIIYIPIKLRSFRKKVFTMAEIIAIWA